MRMVFVFLVLFNVLFAIWQYFLPMNVDAAINPLPDDLVSIQLMRELPSDHVNELSEGESGLRPLRSSCHTLGPFMDSQMTEGLKQGLAEFTDKLAVRVMQENELHRYMVYVAAKNHEDAVVISKLLVLQNVSDFYIMTKAGKSRVSLGHFKEKSYADKRVQQIAELGLKPEIDAVYHQFQLYWLDYELNDVHKSKVDELIAPYLQNEISILNRECEK